MRPPIALVLTLIAAAASAAHPAGDSPLARERRVSAALLAGDARLGQKVSLACKASPMEAMLADLQEKLRIPLAATADTRDEKPRPSGPKP